MDRTPEKKSFPFQIELSDDDIYEAMKDIPGYLDITPEDLKQIYQLAYRHAFERITKSVRARDIMTREVVTVDTKTPLREVAAVMAANGISGVPVLDETGRVSGIISEKDFLSRMGGTETKNFMSIIAECLKGKGCIALPIRAQTAGDIMSSPAVTIQEDTPVMEIADLFSSRKINRTPVLGSGGNLTGIVSRNDIVRASLITRKP